MAMAQVLKLKPAFTDDQAEAPAGPFDQDVATKADLERFKAELQRDVERLRLEVERDLKATEKRILTRMMTLFIGQGIAVVSLVVTLEKMTG